MYVVTVEATEDVPAGGDDSGCRWDELARVGNFATPEDASLAAALVIDTLTAIGISIQLRVQLTRAREEAGQTA